MKRTLILFALFLVLGATAFFFWSRREDPGITSLKEEMDFAVENTDDVYKIFLADHRNNRSTLERKKDHWIYNGQHKANPNAIENLLDAIGRISVKYRPPAAAEKNMVKSLATEGIKVEIYGKGDNLLKTYYVGGSTADERGTYMIMEGSDQPFVAHIPNWVGNVRFRYSLIGLEWRDKALFSEKTENIRSVSIEYPKQKNKSFVLEKEGSDYSIRPFYDITPVIQKPYKRGSAESFLFGFERMVAEAYENLNPKRDSIASLLPFSIITLTDIKGEETQIRLHPIINKTMTQDLKTGEYLTNEQIERFYVESNTGDFLLIQNLVLQKILWGYSFFFEE